jgi:acyl-ACP thioesterase
MILFYFILMFNVFNVLKIRVELLTLKSNDFILFYFDVQCFQHFENKSWITNIKSNDFILFYFILMFNVFNILKIRVELLTWKAMILFYFDVQCFQHFENWSWIRWWIA